MSTKTETSILQPQKAAYAECKGIGRTATSRPWRMETFSPTFLRNARLDGPSPRMLLSFWC